MKKLIGLLVSLALVSYVYAASLNDLQVGVYDGSSFVNYSMVPSDVVDNVLVWDKDAETYKLADVDPAFDVSSGVLNVVPSVLASELNGFVSLPGHTHTIANVINLQSSLDGKASVSHSHAMSDVTGLISALSTKAGTTTVDAFSNGLMSITDKVKLDSIMGTTTQADWNETSTSSMAFIKNKPSISNRTFSYPSRTLNSCFQVSTTSDAIVSYSVDVSTSLSLTTGQTGTVFLEIYSDSGCSTGTQEVSRFVNGNGGTLTVGLALTQNVTGTLNGVIPNGSYVKLRTANTVGTPTFTFRSAQEVKF